MWQLYKESERGRKCIELFNPETDNVPISTCDMIKHFEQQEWCTYDEDYLCNWGFFFFENIDQRDLLPKDLTRESFAEFIENLDIYAPQINENDEIEFCYEDNGLLLPKKVFREKAAMMCTLSSALYFIAQPFKPMLLTSRFDIVQRNCDLLGINLPDIPRSNNYKEYCLYYWDICEAWWDFQTENELSDEETCACIYDYASMLYEEKSDINLPKPTNVWLTGASGSDFSLLDSLGEDKGINKECMWACNEKTKRGDLVIVYCLSPRSYIHSIWRSKTGGIFNPFDYYHCRTSLCEGVHAHHITIKDLKNDKYFSQLPIVRKNLQGINGIEFSAKDYSELLRLMEEKGGNTDQLPKLFECGDVDFGEIKLEKDVEEKILIPLLEKLGYAESDWTRQLSQKAGRNEKAIPDFVFFPKGEKHFASAPMVIEAKLNMSSIQDRQKAFCQCLSYARMLRSSIMGICDKERLILYKVNLDGTADRSHPLFENHWASIYNDTMVGSQLGQLIGKENIRTL